VRLSLRVRVLACVFLSNAALFAAGGAFLARLQERENLRTERTLSDDLLYTLRRSIRPELTVHAAALLEWPSWAAFEDALVVDNNASSPSAGGLPEFRGVRINPLGRLQRPLEFDAQAVQAALFQAIQANTEVLSSGGRAVPIQGPSGVWGACWYRRRPLDRRELVVNLVGWFLASTVLLTVVTYYALDRLVLEPVDRLARGARELREGSLGVRVLEPRRRDEIADLVRSFNAMAADVHGFNSRLAREVEVATAQARQAEQVAMTQRRLAAMGELAAGIAHEINNPLGGLQNAVQRLQAGGLSAAKEAEYLGLLERGLARIGGIVQKLLRFTPRELSHAPVDLADVASDAVDLLRHRADRQGVALEVRSGDEPYALLGARNELGQALLNLLVNALDALEEGGTHDPDGARILVMLSKDAEHVRLAVKDNGPGVPKEELGSLADLFYTTKDVGKGSGLGLALVHNTAVSHGGSLELSSEPGRGFSAELVFPRLSPAEEPAP
jgi:signal transduction histidine kinase